MAELLWGKVYYKDHFAGFLREEPGDRASFTYDESYLDAKHPPIAHTLPLSTKPHISQSGLHPFFDNLVAEGWLEDTQIRLLGKRIASRFELLLAFGHDCIGAVSVVDPEPAKLISAQDISDAREAAVLVSRASLSGVQPKLTLVKEKGILRPPQKNELSTHIAKFSSDKHENLIINEYVTMTAFKALLPNDPIAIVSIENIKNFNQPALVIKRFDRTSEGERIHFEEFNQLLGFPSFYKYDGAYKDMSDFIYETPQCLPAEVYRLYLRVLAGLLLGNTDMHFKNFAMIHTDAGLRLAPSYDQIAAASYRYITVALAMSKSANLSWPNLKPKNLILLGEEFRLSKASIRMAYEEIVKNKDNALAAIASAKWGSELFKQKLIQMVEKRWRGTFALIGKIL